MAPSLSGRTPVVYFLRLRSGVICVGASQDLDQRLEDHASGNACRTTQIDPPHRLLRVEICAPFPEARRREAQFKRWSHAKKAALTRNNKQQLRARCESHD